MINSIYKHLKLSLVLFYFLSIPSSFSTDEKEDLIPPQSFVEVLHYWGIQNHSLQSEIGHYRDRDIQNKKQNLIKNLKEFFEILLAQKPGYNSFDSQVRNSKQEYYVLDSYLSISIAAEQVADSLMKMTQITNGEEKKDLSQYIEILRTLLKEINQDNDYSVLDLERKTQASIINTIIIELLNEKLQKKKFSSGSLRSSRSKENRYLINSKDFLFSVNLFFNVSQEDVREYIKFSRL